MEDLNYPNARDCQHGQLRRSCPHCEYDRDMAEANKKIAQLQQQITELEQQLKTARKEAFKAGADFWAQCELDEAWHRDEDEAAEEYANNLEGK